MGTGRRGQRAHVRFDYGPAGGRGPEPAQRERDPRPESRGRHQDATVPGHLQPTVDDSPRVVRVRPFHARAQHVMVVTPGRSDGRPCQRHQRQIAENRDGSARDVHLENKLSIVHNNTVTENQ